MSSVLSVTQLNKYISFKIKSDLKLKGIAVKGEISNFTLHYKSGHAYFTIKDSDSSLKAVMFSSSVQRLKVLPENGMNVLVVGNIEVYERDGVYQIIATDITPVGQGLLHTKTELIKQKLLKNGFFDENKKKPIPLVPKKIAVVTSLTGAALQDIIHITDRRYPLCQLEIYPALVQGITAKESICSALSQADNSGADTLILARGGGSLEDLMVFNTEEVTMAVANCNTPIITAVGHETDTTLVDYASDMRAPTPSAAAELATPDKNDVLSAVQFLGKRLDSAVNSVLNKYSNKFDEAERNLSLSSPQNKLETSELKLKSLIRNLNLAINKTIDDKSRSLDKNIAALNALSPFNVLNRGYSLVEKDSKIVNSAGELEIDDTVTIKFADSYAVAKITDKQNAER